jgi:hypothetical protein
MAPQRFYQLLRLIPVTIVVVLLFLHSISSQNSTARVFYCRATSAHENQLVLPLSLLSLLGSRPVVQWTRPTPEENPEQGCYSFIFGTRILAEVFSFEFLHLNRVALKATLALLDLVDGPTRAIVRLQSSTILRFTVGNAWLQARDGGSNELLDQQVASHWLLTNLIISPESRADFVLSPFSAAPQSLMKIEEEKVELFVEDIAEHFWLGMCRPQNQADCVWAEVPGTDFEKLGISQVDITSLERNSKSNFQFCQKTTAVYRKPNGSSPCALLQANLFIHKYCDPEVDKISWPDSQLSDVDIKGALANIPNGTWKQILSQRTLRCTRLPDWFNSIVEGFSHRSLMEWNT